MCKILRKNSFYFTCDEIVQTCPRQPAAKQPVIPYLYATFPEELGKIFPKNQNWRHCYSICHNSSHHLYSDESAEYLYLLWTERTIILSIPAIYHRKKILLHSLQYFTISQYSLTSGKKLTYKLFNYPISCLHSQLLTFSPSLKIKRLKNFSI